MNNRPALVRRFWELRRAFMQPGGITRAEYEYMKKLEAMLWPGDPPLPP